MSDDTAPTNSLDYRVKAALDAIVSFLRANPVAAAPSVANAEAFAKRLSELRTSVAHFGLGDAYDDTGHVSYQDELQLGPLDSPLTPEARARLFATAEAAVKSGHITSEVADELMSATFGSPDSSSPPKGAVAAAARASSLATTGFVATDRALVWKLFVIGPSLTALYATGLDEAAAATSIGIGRVSLRPSASGSADPPGSEPKDLVTAALSSAQPNLARTLLRGWVGAEEYLKLVARGPSKRFPLIRDDSFRTFNSSDKARNPFLRNVPEQAIVRVCSAFDHKFGPLQWEYCQGMNVYAGMFLYVMPELDAFNCFALFCTQAIPQYWQANHIGVEAGCKLVDRILNAVDEELYTCLARPPANSASPTGLTAILYAFPCVKTMSAMVAPLDQAVRLWDLQLALGPAASPFCVVAQLIGMRARLMATESPKTLLDYRKWPPLLSESISATALAVIAEVQEKDPEVVKEALLHAVDSATVRKLTLRSNYKG